MHCKPLLGTALISACLVSFAGTAPADEVRLKDGRVYCGKVREEAGDLIITTRDGALRVPRSQVESIRDAAALERELGDLATRFGDSGFSKLQLAQLARDWGLVDAMWVHADAALAARQASIEELLRVFLAGCEPEILPPHLRKAATENRVQELLWRIHRESTPAKIAAITEILVREPNAEAALRKKARQATIELQRTTALEVLSRRSDRSSDRFVWRSTLLDPALHVRERAADLAKVHGKAKEAVAYLAGALENEDSDIRVRAAEAFTRIGEKDAIDVLVKAGPKAGVKEGGSPRAHCAFLTQESYVRDFDVEVAQNAVIANPRVDVLQSGAVLDVAVHAVQIYRIEIVHAYRKALKSLAGADPGPDPASWSAWRERLASTAGSAPVTSSRPSGTQGEMSR